MGGSGASAEQPDEEKLAIATESSRLQHKNKKGQLLLELDSRSSVTKLNRDNPEDVQSELKGVSGRLYQEGALASRFSAPAGHFDRRNQSLRLESGVKVTSEEQKVVLTAQRIRWSESQKVIIAEGDVWLKGDSFESGPAPRLAATPDLKRFGTPDRIKP